MERDNITVRINGERRAVPAGQSMAELLGALNVSSDRVAIELNKSIVRKRDWHTATVPDNAEIEIVEFVGGG